jgi:GT2 family glycosyltransferase
VLVVVTGTGSRQFPLGARDGRLEQGSASDIVIVTHNSADVIEGCLASLPDAFAETMGRLVVVDNSSWDRTVEVARAAAPDAVVVERDDNAGYAAGINEGVAALAGTGPVVILNPDVRLRPGAGDALVAALTEPGVGICVPRLADEAGDTLLSLRREPTVSRALGEALLGGRRAGRCAPLGEVVSDLGRYEQPGPADWATGAVMAISRTCLEDTGPWDESFFLYSEETDFALRARDRGWTLWFEPRAVAVHLGGPCRTSPPLWRLLAWNRVDLYRRRQGRWRGLAFHGAVLLNEAVRASDPVHRSAALGLLSSVRPTSGLTARSATAG